MTISLRQAALDAAASKAREAHDERAAERERALTDLCENWQTKARLGVGGESLPWPGREAFDWTGYPGYSYGHPGGRTPTVHGWTWTIDGVTFIYDASYNGQGLCVVLTCPDCGENHADHVYGLDGLGKALNRGRHTGHECHAVATRALAHAIRHAAQTTRMTPATVTDHALSLDIAYPR